MSIRKKIILRIFGVLAVVALILGYFIVENILPYAGYWGKMKDFILKNK